jgi:hypothetical protein
MVEDIPSPSKIVRGGNVVELPKGKDMDHESNLQKNGSKNGNVVKIGIIGVGGWGKKSFKGSS